MSSIRYVQRNAIDTARWNTCIDAAPNGLIYAYSYYLDAVADNWDGLIYGDYEAVMPLPWRRKWGIKYIYQPFAVAQTGVFGATLNEGIIHEVLKKIPPQFRLIQLPLNGGNLIKRSCPFVKRRNYILNLHESYPFIQARYRTQLKRNLKKAKAEQLVLLKNIDLDTVLRFSKQHPANRATKKDHDNFKHLYGVLKKLGKANTYAVTNAQQTIIASAVFFFSHQRAYYVLPGNNLAFRNSGASHFLLDTFIQENAGSHMLLDFEGSDVPGVAFFYASFGAYEEFYPHLMINRLPNLLRWLK